MRAKIGHAEHDENGKSKGGRSGDQNGKEVYIREWYARSKGWDQVVRPKSQKDAEAIASAMEKACANPHIGYDQDQRTTLWTEAEKAGWQLDRVTKDCETDCSALVAVCCMCAGIKVSKDMYTGNELVLLKKTERFTVYTEKGYLDNDRKLKRGDILIGPGHTAIVVESGKACTIELEELGKGDRGDSVMALQAMLSAYGYDPKGIDGVFGDGCLKAVKKFQKKNNLTADGIVGSATWDALLN